ncbi:MAG: serine/threonine-protein kinase [Kofleriaceae bacterium]
MRQPVPFGKYLLLDRISVGGMAEVFKAKSYGVEGFEKVIAIKRILPSIGEDREFIKMFVDEAKIVGQLAHANICQIFELGRIDGSHFIAMEFIWGKDLLQIQNRLRKLGQPLAPAMSAYLIAKACEGLDHAHRKKDAMGRPLEIVHRDCSPQNILVSYEGEVKVIDFGIAKAASRSSRTMAGVLKGKFSYMSPEQVRGLPLDRRSDIFALGTVLYECVTGEKLFQAETDFATLEKVRNVDVASPRSVNPAVPPELERIILRALARDAEDRYPWCSDLAADLQQFLMSQDVVYTAKTLASWLRETFAADMARERRQLDEYKQLGREGAPPPGTPKLDVVSAFGPAGAPEGEATVLGAPAFTMSDDAPMGDALDDEGGPTGVDAEPVGRAAPNQDFTEEAPTEIFGGLGDVAKLAASSAGAPARPRVDPAAAAAAAAAAGHVRGPAHVSLVGAAPVAVSSVPTRRPRARRGRRRRRPPWPRRGRWHRRRPRVGGRRGPPTPPQRPVPRRARGPAHDADPAGDRHRGRSADRARGRRRRRADGGAGWRRRRRHGAGPAPLDPPPRRAHRRRPGRGGAHRRRGGRDVGDARRAHRRGHRRRAAGGRPGRRRAGLDRRARGRRRRTVGRRHGGRGAARRGAARRAPRRPPQPPGSRRRRPAAASAGRRRGRPRRGLPAGVLQAVGQRQHRR